MTTYIGSELNLFAKAINWKSYYGRMMKKYLGEDILEVGAGIGSTTESLCDGARNRWVCLEPDREMAAAIQSKISIGLLPDCCEAFHGAVQDLSAESLFDTIIYIDVLEHILEDAKEMAASMEHLKRSGHLIVLSPAHQFLYTSFDKEIGHHRRYNHKTLLATVPRRLRLVELRYLDCVGMFASLGNRFLLRSSMPTERQIELWDKMMIPLSRAFDPLSGYKFGKSILGVWRKDWDQ